MAITYAWEIVNMETKDQTNTDGVVLQNAVVKVVWKRIGTDTDSTNHSFLGTSFFTAENVEEGDFVGFFDLTESTVQGWITSKLGAGEIQKIDDIIARRIDKKNTIVRQVPWS